MELLSRLDTESLLTFNLILGSAMAVILLVTRLGLGGAAHRVDVWLAGALMLLAGRLCGPLALTAGIVSDPSRITLPLILAGLACQAEGLRLLRGGPRRRLQTIALALGVVVLESVVQARFDDRAPLFLFSAVTLLLMRNAALLCRRSWGGRLLLAASAVLLAFNVGEVFMAGALSGPQIARRGLILEMTWALFSTAGFLQCLQQDLRDQLDAAAVTDALTGALNRAGVIPLLRRDLALARRGHDVAVVLCDLDHFKAINDTHGHAAGDLALQHFVAQGRACLGAVDLLARWGGEEFLLVLPRSSLDEAMALTRRLQRALATAPAEPAFTFSAGVSCTSERGADDDLEKLLALADRRLYIAKRTRNLAVCDDAR